ncbi:MAG TPA: maleylpyruvate isomerase N-terminal domain-containing protein [Mycobacteriales bacterium]|nr:maleylpyruvate isomerase N-terminal domain-containing protein [Mycobacteriales bacterium]
MVPTPGRGLSSAPLAPLLDRMARSWQLFVEVAESADLDAPTRLPGWQARDVVVHLGTWDDRAPLIDAIRSARAGADGAPMDPDTVNAAVIAEHRDASDDEVLDALRRSRDGILAINRRELATLATAPAMSMLGPLPLAGLVHAGCYELAVHALDLHAAGAVAPDPALLDAGLAALIDVTGALAARHGITIAVSAQTPTGGWRAEIEEDQWTTTAVPAGSVAGPAILGTAVDVLDASAGRVGVPVLLLQRRIVVQDLTQFLRLAPLVEQVPGIPGAALLSRAAATVTGLTGLLSRLRR